MGQNAIVIKGAREHNLKDIDLSIPRDELVVITGLSGSGKSSLAFDTMYAEGQRRYVESLSSYARMFLGQISKPDLDSIDGLSPAVSIDQKTTSKNPRSTVGTTTEIYDYLRLLFARVGVPHCPECGRVIKKQTTDQVTDEILALAPDAKAIIMAPVVAGRKGEFTKLFADLQKEGFSRVRIDGEIVKLDGKPVDESTLASVLLFISCYAMITLGASLVVALNDFPFTETLTSVITCISNTGPGLGAVGPAGNFSAFSPLSKLVLSLCMIIGRLEIFPILVLFSRHTWRRN